MKQFCIIRSEDIQLASKKILAAVDSSELSKVTESLQLKSEGSNLYLSVTNGDYFVKIRIEMDEPLDFHATVNANLFLKLISQITTDTIELTVTDTALRLKGNGSYQLPLIFLGEELATLPEIEIKNPTANFGIDAYILNSIANYNSKELDKGAPMRPAQNYYYIDEQGCITYRTGACVNSFSLKQPVKLLLNNRLVKLFKLFKDEEVNFTLGYDALSDEIIQTKVRFETNDVSITAILSCDNTLLDSVPVSAIRDRAYSEYPYSINLNKDGLVQAINRLALFAPTGNVDPDFVFEFDNDRVTIYDPNQENSEEVYYTSTVLNLPEPYRTSFNLDDIKKTLDSCAESYITLNFGNEEAITIARNKLINVIQEIRD